MERLVGDRLTPVYMAAAFIVMLAVYEWRRSLISAPPHPVPISILAAAIVGYAVYRFLNLRKRMRSLRLGLEGEKVVGRHLEALRANGYRVFHDIPAKGFNVDHVLVGPAGVFAIETKTYSKPVKGDAKATYDGDRILVNGWEPERNGVAQVRAVRDWVRDLLFETTGKHYQVRGVVLMPGWWIDPPADKARADVWVLNPKALLSFLEHEPVVLKEEDVALVSSRLSNYVTRS